MNGSNEQEQGATPSGSGCQPSGPQPASQSSQSGIPSADIAWGYRDLVACLQALHPDLGVHTIEGRLKNTKQAGLMPHARTGKGHAYSYPEREVLFLALLTEMGQMGFSPAKASSMMHEADWLNKWHTGVDAYYPLGGSASAIVLDYGRVADAIIAARPEPKPALPRTLDVIDIRTRRSVEIGVGSPQMPRSLSDDLLTGADEIAAYIGWPTRRVYRAVETSLIPFFKKGSLILARKSELDAAFSSGGAA